MNTALVVNGSASGSPELYSALLAAGCSTVTTVSLTVADALASSRSNLPSLIVLAVGDIRLLQKLVPLGVPIVVVCREQDTDAVFLAGAAECVTRPLRVRELEGRLRRVIRIRDERAIREGKLSDRIVALQREKGDLQRLVSVDTLTGIANRRHVLSTLDTEWRRAARDGTPLAVVMIDLDCFHAYNETYGHLGGDRCLQQVTEAMSRCLRRSSDCLGRYGGEEFVAILPNTDDAGAKAVAESLRAAVEELAIPHAGSVCSSAVTITSGYTSQHYRPGLDVAQLIGSADAALMAAKADGRNRVSGDVLEGRRAATKLGIASIGTRDRARSA